MNNFVVELIATLNQQYPRHHFDDIVEYFVNDALKKSGFCLTPVAADAEQQQALSAAEPIS